MGIVNKRNAVVGWIALKVGKRVVKKKAHGAVGTGKRTPGAAAGVVAALGGALLFWRKKRAAPSSE